jgi:FkbM family methyltransferase
MEKVHQLFSRKIMKFFNKIKTHFTTLVVNEHPFKFIMTNLILLLPFDVGKIVKFKIRAHDYYIRFHKSSMTLLFWSDSNARKDDHAFIKDYLKRGDIYIDVGANIGSLLIPAAQVVIDGKAVGIEAHPKIFAILKENIYLNRLQSSCEIYNYAIGNERKNVVFSDFLDDDQNRILPGQRTGLIVKMVRLDDICEKFFRIALLKIDVEGFEKAVLEGGHKTLSKTECVYIEVNKKNYNYYGHDIRETVKIIENLGFKIFRKVGENKVSLVNNYQPFESGENLFGIRNIKEFIRRTGWKTDEN